MKVYLFVLPLILFLLARGDDGDVSKVSNGNSSNQTTAEADPKHPEAKKDIKKAASAPNANAKKDVPAKTSPVEAEESPAESDDTEEEEETFQCYLCSDQADSQCLWENPDTKVDCSEGCMAANVTQSWEKNGDATAGYKDCIAKYYVECLERISKANLTEGKCVKMKLPKNTAELMEVCMKHLQEKEEKEQKAEEKENVEEQVKIEKEKKKKKKQGRGKKHEKKEGKKHKEGKTKNKTFLGTGGGRGESLSQMEPTQLEDESREDEDDYDEYDYEDEEDDDQEDEKGHDDKDEKTDENKKGVENGKADDDIDKKEEPKKGTGRRRKRKDGMRRKRGQTTVATAAHNDTDDGNEGDPIKVEETTVEEGVTFSTTPDFMDEIARNLPPGSQSEGLIETGSEVEFCWCKGDLCNDIDKLVLAALSKSSGGIYGQLNLILGGLLVQFLCQNFDAIPGATMILLAMLQLHPSQADQCSEPPRPNVTGDPITKTIRPRYCFHCEDDERNKEKCYLEPKELTPKEKEKDSQAKNLLKTCGHMGDEACTCVQYWTNINRDNGKYVRVRRACMSFHEVTNEFGFTIDDTEEIVCSDNATRRDGTPAKACFCEADKCNRRVEKFDSGTLVKAWIVIVIMGLSVVVVVQQVF